MKNLNNKQIKIKDIITKLQINSFFYILLIATFITSIPTPALGLGTSTLPGGLICLILSIQMILGFKNIYLPDFLNIKVKKSIIDRLTTYITKIRQIRKSDNKFFNLKILHKLSGLIIFCNGVLMCIPLVFTNWHPSISTSIISLAHITKNKNLLILFYFLSVFMFIGYALLFYLIINFIKQYSKNFSLYDLKTSKYMGFLYLLSFFVICASIFCFIVIFVSIGYFSKNMYIKLFTQ